MEALANLVHRHWDALQAAAPAEGEKGKKSKGKAKKDGEPDGARELRDGVVKLLEDGARTPDLALFGRMIADRPEWNVDAACQVAHAISTNRVAMDFDFYTAVDDFRPADTAGSDMMGTVQFNSSCFYRYAVVDVDQLERNLSADRAYLRRTLDAFLRAAVGAVPTGKQNSMAAQNPPSYVLSVVRDRGGPVSLANAFLEPARPSERAGVDLVGASIDKLEEYFSSLTRMLGAKPALAISCADRKLREHELIDHRESLDDVVKSTLARLGAGDGA